ncbi:type II secretion system protein [Pseudoduganella violaceinigra]|uniref:type II secretion system protein n=1 Tax=Pseudoduganella violaceinigra TaxID=246602 RepID=UPI00054F0892|nr:type II secretion system protein [Pseudoduganella violaceinigra]
MTAAANPIPTGKQHGFTYISVVILVTIIGLVGAMALRLGTTIQRAYAEQALLDIGMEYSNALASYAAATPEGQPNYPKSFAELLKDPRFPGLRRHLRRIYVDPMTGKAEWGIVKANETGGILAIYSLSKAAPIKIGNFPARFVAFEGKASLGDWKFSGEGVQTPGGKGGDGQTPGQLPGQPPKGTPPGGMTGTQPGTVPENQPGSKPGTPQEPPKPTAPPPEPPPEPEPPQEPQEPPQEPQEPSSEPAREEPPAPPARR